MACIDCHDPETMQLRITRPSFMTGIRAAKLAEEGIADYDVNTMATRQEMRTFVCAQCHVEYYFAPDESRRLTFPWYKGRRADQILDYYSEIGFTDWTHKETGAQMLKAQHPEFEMWSQGTHSAAGVACADCHMPYMRQGGLKISDHHVRSPLLNINNSCQTCHKVSEEELLQRVNRIQERTVEMCNMALEGLATFIDDLVEAKDGGLAEAQLHEAYQCQRGASFLIDIVQSENSHGFHAPQESARLLFKAMDYLRRGEIALQAKEIAAKEEAPSSLEATETAS